MTAAAKLKVNAGHEPGTDLGPMISADAKLRTLKILDTVASEGGALALDGRGIKVDAYPKGNFVGPTIITGVSSEMTCYKEEIFGPVLTVQTFRTIDEVLQKANNSPYGLAAGVWTDKGARIFGLSSQLQAGVVWANTYNKFDPASPFGGYKESGFGREGGLHGLSAYLKFIN